MARESAEGFTMKASAIFGLLTLTVSFAASAQIYDTNNPTVSTFAGSGYYGDVDGTGVYTMFYNPEWIVYSAPFSSMYVVDSGDFKIRTVLLTANVSTPLGYGPYQANAITLDPSGNLWMVLSSGGMIFENGQSKSLNLAYTTGGLCFDSQTNLYYSDQSGNKIYKYTPTNVYVFAGSGNPAYGDGWWIFTGFNSPKALACDSANNIYVWDSANYVIRKIDQSSNVTTFTGTYEKYSLADGPPGFCGISTVYQMCFDGNGNLILACGNSIRKVDPTGYVTTIAGSFYQSGYTNSGTFSLFNGAEGVCVCSNSIFVSDTQNQRIRQISYNATQQVVPPSQLSISNYPGVAINGTIGRTYQIQSSPDMNTWTAVATVLINSTPYLWIDQSGQGAKKFYRAIMLP